MLSQDSIPKIERDFKNAFELRHDNDFLVYTDRYYTTGSFIGLRTRADKKHDSANRRQFRFYIQQEIYTPTDLLEVIPEKFDRPYAGFMGLSSGLTLSNGRRLIDLELVFGFSGPFSFAKELQSYFHETAAEDSRVPIWEDQIKTQLHGNLYARYLREWQLNPAPFKVFVATNPTIAFGTRDIYAQQDVVFYFGKRNGMQTSAAYQQVGNYKNELFFAVRLAYRYLFHDSLIEGALWRVPTEFTKDPYNQLVFYNFEVYHRRKRNTFMISYNFESPRARGTQEHLYMSFSFIRIF